MKRLNFDDEYVRSILDGEKVTTIRKGVKDYQVNEIVELTVNHKPFAKARILDVVTTPCPPLPWNLTSLI